MIPTVQLTKQPDCFSTVAATPPAASAYLLQQDEIVGVDIEMSTQDVTYIHSDLVQCVKLSLPLSSSAREPFEINCCCPGCW